MTARAVSGDAVATCADVRVLAFVEALGLTGPARNLLALAPHLDLHLATFRRLSLGSAHCEGLDAFAASARARGVPLHVVDERSRFDWHVLDGIAGLLTTLRPDIVESHHLKSHALLALARRRAGMPWIAWHHGYTKTDLKVLAYNHVDRWSLPKADLVVTTCRPFARTVAGYGVPEDRVRVVHNAVDGPRGMARSWARAQLGLDHEIVLLAVGRLSREKGFDVLIDACARLTAPVRGKLLVLFAGSGPDRSRLERQARRRGVAARFDGHRPNLAPYYAAADIFALASRSDGSPNALLEAMAARKAIAAAAVGGVPEIVDARSAMLVPPEDPAALAAAIARLIAFPDLAARLGAAAEAAATRFSPERRAAHVLGIYRTVLEPTAHTIDRASER